MITGGGRGLGRAIAGGFADSGATVAIIGRDEARLSAAVTALRETGGKAHFFIADVADEAGLAVAFERLRGEIGDPGVLVNNAGINPWYRRAEQVSLAEWRQILDINLTAVFHCCQLVAPAMLAGGRGSIINISSVSGLMGLAGQANYAASKAGLIGMSKSIAREIASRGITVNVVAPGFIETDMTSVLNEEVRKGALSQIPVARFGATEDIAAAVSFLASAEASYITGQVIAVDGGMSM